ncbi:MAG: N-acetylneuraminate synthase family protein [Proteobacteria bacterium]|nr:N-acetylneuraminate synthase family protein [Pseudomonadota bacterium]
MTQSVQIASSTIGPGHPCYLIAEVGTTCLGDMELALSLIRAGAQAGVDAVKFQVIDPHQDSEQDAEYGVVWDGESKKVNMQKMFLKLAFSPAEWQSIASACKENGVEFLATVDYIAGVDMLDEIGILAHKIGAWDTTYRPLIERIGQTGKLMMVDLGPTTSEEIKDLSDWYYAAGGSAIIFLHDYHTIVADEMNMRAVPHLMKIQDWPVGYSSPNRLDDLDFVSLGLGTNMIEKRLILDRSLHAFHSHESLEPGELKAWVERIRKAERALGEEAIQPSRRDLDHAENYYRSICTLRPVAEGEVFTTENLCGKRPGTGIPTKRIAQLLGRRASRDIVGNVLISEDDVR